jgi:formylglycine-generating enzyme required for sulfatase activity
MRGGSWDNDARYCRSAMRNEFVPGNRGDDLGFRLSRFVSLGSCV